MLLKDTFGVVQQSSKASDTTSGKLPESSTFIGFESIVSERILPIQPPSSSQLNSSMSEPIFSQPTTEPILLPPPTETPTIEPVTEYQSQQ